MKKWFMKCPYCANEIKKWAIKCQYCEEFLNWDKYREIKNNQENWFKWNKKNKLIIIIMILIALFWLWFSIKSYFGWYSMKRLCKETLDDYVNYLNDARNVNKPWWYYQYVNDIDSFYSSIYNSCVWSFYLSSNMYSSTNNETKTYMIYYYLDWKEKEIFSCFTENEPDCLSKWEKKKSELKK